MAHAHFGLKVLSGVEKTDLRDLKDVRLVCFHFCDHPRTTRQFHILIAVLKLVGVYHS